MDTPLNVSPPRKGGGLKWLLLGCGGLILLGLIGVVVVVVLVIQGVAGTEVASAAGTVGQESTVTFQVAESVPHVLWLEYDIAYSGGFQLSGPIVVRTAAGVVAQDALTLGPQGAPTAGATGRIEVNSRNVELNGQGTAASRVRLLDIPPQVVGAVVTGGVTVTPSAGVVVRALRLVVTR